MNAGPPFSAGAFKLYCSAGSEDGASSFKTVKESQPPVEVAANNGPCYWVPTRCLTLLDSVHELAHIILPPTLQDTLLSPFARWGSWLQTPCYFQYRRWLPMVRHGGRFVVPQSDLESRKTLSQLPPLLKPMGVEEMVLKPEFINWPSEECFPVSNKTAGLSLLSTEEAMLRWSWPAFG